jgi:hypothetical protein
MNLDVERDVLAPLGERAAAARALLAHDRNRLTTSAGKNGFHYLDVITGKNVSVRGLTVVLKERCWSLNKPPRTLAPPPGYIAVSHNAAGERRLFKAPRRGLDAARGRVRGTLVHAQVRDLCFLDREHYHRTHPEGAHPWSLQLLDTVTRQGWTPLAAEFIVYNAALRIGTAVDMVAVDKQGTLIFLEFKTGYAGDAWCVSSGPMRGALGAAPPSRVAMADTARNRAMIQVMLGALLAVHGHQVDGRIECWVLRVDDAGTELLQLSKTFLLAHGNRILAAWAQEERQRRR